MRELGPDIRVDGGVHVDILQNSTPEAIRAETKRIIHAVKPYTKRFVMKEANNLPPCTPPVNIRAMYETVLEYGRYD
jgi:uroporphyrinogen-III decarboxylase